MQKIRLKIIGMHCTSCAMNIDFDLEDLEGVKRAQTNYAKQISDVEFDSRMITVAKIIEQIKKTGYRPARLFVKKI